ncbi:PLP-dependent aminotransferase family protein [Shewanella sp. OPT22]|nr:PLP-dependent aminotransferase family protein [Shewanella sp. OPT22]
MGDYKYKQLWELLNKQIDSGVLVEKLPSVRQFATENDVSISTVLQAYAELETQGKVIAEPKRGYFIQQPQFRPSQTYNYGSHSVSVSLGKNIYQEVQYSLNDPSLLPLSSTAPSSVVDSSLQLTRLARRCLTAEIFKLDKEDPVTGLPELKVALCKYWFNRFGIITPKQLVIVSGRIQALQTAITGLDLRGERIAIESPVSFYFRSGLAPLKLDVIEIPQQQDYQAELELLDKTFLQTPFKCFLVNPSFNDPTGRILSDKEKLMLLTWAKKRNVILIEYDRSPLHFFGNKPLSLAELATNKGFSDIQIVSVGDYFDTISMTFSLGYMVCIGCSESISLAKQVTSEPATILFQRMLISLLESGKYIKHLNQIRKEMRLNHQKCIERLNFSSESKLSISQVSGGPCLWIKLPEGHSSEDLWHKAIDKKVAVAPGKIFTFRNEYDDFFRITFALPFNQEMEEGLLSLSKLLTEY